MHPLVRKCTRRGESWAEAFNRDEHRRRLQERHSEDQESDGMDLVTDGDAPLAAASPARRGMGLARDEDNVARRGVINKDVEENLGGGGAGS
jgi:hypothetical protein